MNTSTMYMYIKSSHTLSLSCNFVNFTSVKLGKKDYTKYARMWRVWTIHILLVEMWNGTITLESLAVSFKNWTCNDQMTQTLYSGHLSQRNEDLHSHKNMYMDVNSRFTQNTKKVEKTRCFQWVNIKLWHIHTMEYYTISELIHTIIWINLEGIMLCEKRQSRKVTYCVVPFI